VPVYGATVVDILPLESEVDLLLRLDELEIAGEIVNGGGIKELNEVKGAGVNVFAVVLDGVAEVRDVEMIWVKDGNV